MTDGNVRFPFSMLPLELFVHIVKIAATPEVDCYKCGLSLCHVSKEVRHVALQGMLHTVFLSRKSSVSKFANSLRMQRTFAETNRALFVDYTLYVSNVWITQHPGAPPPLAPSVPQAFCPSILPNEDDDLPLLAPVILGATSLLFDDASMSFICDCLAWAWEHHAAISSLQSLSHPWRTRKLALLGTISRWLPFTSSPEGSAFLASIRSLSVLPDKTSSDELEGEQGWDRDYWGIRKSIPLHSFHNLRKLVTPLIWFGPSEEEGEDVRGWCWHTYVRIRLLVIGASTMTWKEPTTRKWVDHGVDAYLRGKTTQLTPVYPYLVDEFGPDAISIRWEPCWPDNLLDD